jgi:phage shock protein A
MIMMASLFGPFTTAVEILGMMAGLLVLLFLVLTVLNKHAAGSWWFLARTRAGQVGDYAAGVDPAAQMRQAALDATRDLATADEALKACERLKIQLRRQVENDTVQLNRLVAQIAKRQQDGATDNDRELVEKAQRVKKLRADIAENQSQLQQQEAIYDNTKTTANYASERIAGAFQRASRLKVKLQMGEQGRKMLSLLKQYNPNAIDMAMSNIDRYEQAAQNQLDDYQAELNVAADRGHLRPPQEDGEDVADILAGIRSAGQPSLPTNNRQ